MQKLNLCKEVLENALRVYQNMDDCGMEMSAFEIVSAQAIEELLKYREIGTVDECRAAVKKQQAMKPKNMEYKRSIEAGWHYACPVCGCAIGENAYDTEVTQESDYCDSCGQKLDWESEGEE